MDDMTYYTHYKLLMIFHTSSVWDSVAIYLIAMIRKCCIRKSPRNTIYHKQINNLLKIFMKRDLTCIVSLFVKHFDVIVKLAMY